MKNKKIIYIISIIFLLISCNEYAPVELYDNKDKCEYYFFKYNGEKIHNPYCLNPKHNENIRK